MLVANPHAKGQISSHTPKQCLIDYLHGLELVTLIMPLSVDNIGNSDWSTCSASNHLTCLHKRGTTTLCVQHCIVQASDEYIYNRYIIEESMCFSVISHEYKGGPSKSTCIPSSLLLGVSTEVHTCSFINNDNNHFDCCLTFFYFTLSYE